MSPDHKSRDRHHCESVWLVWQCVYVCVQKGSGYHLDLLVIALQIVVCSLLGTPWFVAATVLSINHIRSLTRESECAAPGERPKFLGVRQVFTYFCAFALICVLKQCFVAHLGLVLCTVVVVLSRSLLWPVQILYKTVHVVFDMIYHFLPTRILSCTRPLGLVVRSRNLDHLAADMKILKTFHFWCQRKMLWIRWKDRVWNADIFIRTRLPSIIDLICKWRSSVFCHVTRLPASTPAHQALKLQVDLSLNWFPSADWKHRLGCLHGQLVDQLHQDNQY